MQPVNPRIQLLGSGGFSPRFPSIPPALVCTSLALTDVQSRFSCMALRRNLPERLQDQFPQRKKACVTARFHPPHRAHGLSDKPTPELVTDLPSRSIRIGVNPVGLLACGSSDRSCLPSAPAPVACLLRSSPLTVAGPRRNRTGFPINTESSILYGRLTIPVKESWPRWRLTKRATALLEKRDEIKSTRDLRGRTHRISIQS